MTEKIFHPVPFSFVPRICWVFLKNHLFVRKMVVFWWFFRDKKSEKTLDGGVFLNVFVQQKMFEEKTLSDGKHMTWEKKSSPEKCDIEKVTSPTGRRKKVT